MSSASEYEQSAARQARSNGSVNGHDGPGLTEGLGRAIAQGIQSRIPKADLDERDPDYIRETLPGLWLLASFYFRADVKGLENIPAEGPVLLVGNHSGGNMTPDTLVLSLAFNTYFGVERRFYQLAHNLVVSMPFLASLRKYGTVAASPENAQKALDSGAALLVYPGGDYEVHRPSWESARVDFNGRKGYVRLALEHDVPIVPIVALGGQETALFLSRGERLAKLLRLDKTLRLKVLPISIAVPWGLNVGDMMGHFPLPAKLQIRALPAIDIKERFGSDPDIDEVDEYVLAKMQATLDSLNEQRTLPLIGSRVDEQILIDATVAEVWEVVSDLPRWERLFATATRFEQAGGPERGLGARYQLRLHLGSAHVGSLIEIVECDPPGDLAWTSVMGLDQRGRWRLRETDDGRTRVSLRLSYQAPGVLGIVADRVAGPMVSGTLSETLERLKREVEGDRYMGDGSKDDGGLVSSVTQSVEQAIETVRTVWSAGLVRPSRPDRIARSLMAVQKWGYTPATGYIANAVRFPDQDAVIDDLGRLTFAEVHDRTNRLASGLADAGVLEGDGVAIMCRNHRYFVESVVACSKLGAHALFLNTAFAGPQLTEVVKREKPVAIIYDEEFSELLEDAGRRRKRFIGWYDSEDPADPTIEDLIADGDPADPVPPEESGRVVILTSGTTGTPKGASRKQAESIAPAIALLSRIPLHAGEKALIAAPLFHSWGFAHFTLGMALSHTLVLQRRFKPEDTLAGVGQHQAQSCPMVPVMVQRIMDLPEETRRKYDTSSLRAVPLSGSALPGDLAINFMDEFGDILYNLYGSTEVAWATIATPDDLRAAPGTAGKPPMGTVLRIYDENGNEVPQGKEGRIFVGNEMLFEGYTGGGSKDVIDGLMATGDVGYIDEEGRLFVSGRDDEMIVSGGENVFPREVEDTISKLDGVNEVAVIGVEDEEWGQRLKAFVVKKGSGVTEDAIKKHVKSNLAGYKVPREVEFLKELPRNATGKVLKRELAEKEEDGDSKSSSKKKKAAAKS